MALRSLKPVEGTKDNPIFQLSATESCSNFIKAARLKKKADAGDENAKKQLLKMDKKTMYIKE